MSKNKFDNLVVSAAAPLSSAAPGPDSDPLLPENGPEVAPEAPEMALTPDSDVTAAATPSEAALATIEIANSEANIEKLTDAFMEKNPSGWAIVSNGDDTVTATHFQNGAVFYGTVKEFNVLLRS